MEAIADTRTQVLATLDTAYKGRVSNVRASLEQAHKCLAKARVINDPGLVGKCLNDISLYYMIVGENKLSMDAANEAVGYFSALGDELGIADAKFNIGSVLYKTDNYHAGMTNLVDALTIYRKHKEYAKESRVHKALGTIYEFFSDEKNALASYGHAIEAARKVSDLNLESNAYNPLSGIYLNQQNLEKAVELIEKSILLKTSTRDVRGLAFALYGRGKIFTHTGRFAEAEADFLEAERIHLDVGEKLGLAMVYYKMGVLYTAMGNAQLAMETLFKGREVSIQNNIAQFKHKCDYMLYQAYKQQGDIVNAMKYLEEHLREKEAVINTETLKVIENYELISRQQLLENIELKTAKEHVEIQNKALRKANAELDQFVYHTSHDLRAPLCSILGLVNIGLSAKDPEEMKSCFALINDRIKAQDYFIREIVEVSRNSRLEPESKEILPGSVVREIVNTLSSPDVTEKIAVTVDIDDSLTVYSDPSRFKSIVTNLIDNAIKYRDESKERMTIAIRCSCAKSQMTFTIEDNGMGILEDRQDKVFNMFYRGTEHSNGSGLGLFIVKETIEALGGMISFRSKYGAGTTFTFTLPVGKHDEVHK